MPNCRLNTSNLSFWLSGRLIPTFFHFLIFQSGVPSQLIFYERKDDTGPKISDYHIAQVTDPEGIQVLDYYLAGVICNGPGPEVIKLFSCSAQLRLNLFCLYMLKCQQLNTG